MQKNILMLFNFFFLNVASFLMATTVSASTLPSRLSAIAYAGDFTVGQADFMLPVVGDSSHNLYLDPNVAYASNKQGYADLGLGYRWIQNYAAILGIYLFGGYSRVDSNARLWIINPGIEALGSRWDARLNGYIPIGDRNYGGNFLGAQPIRFAGHTEFDNFFHVVQHAGDGVDVKVGYQLFPRTPLKAYLGSYFFSPSQTDNIWGGATGLEYWPNSNVKVFASYNYDNVQHSTGALGLGIEFGGTRVHRSDPLLAERITDPVERYLAELGQGSAIPTRKTYKAIDIQFKRNNIAFFNQIGTPNNGGTDLTIANCTFENPCGPTDLTDSGVARLSELLPDTVMYFNGGNYNALHIPGGSAGVTLQPGQSIQSRTTDYMQDAVGSARSTFNGGFFLGGNNTLSNIILLPTSDTKTGEGVIVRGGTNLITGSQIGSSANPFKVGVDFENSQGVINQSEIFAGEDNAKGLIAKSRSDAKIINSKITVKGSGDIDGILSSSDSTINASNIKVQVTGTGSNQTARGLNAINSSINARDSTITVTGSGDIDGILSSDSTINANNIKVQVTGTGSNQTVRGLNAISSSINARDSVITVTGSGDVDGILSSLNSAIDANNIQVQVTSTGHIKVVRGLTASNASIINITNSVVIAKGPGDIYGITSLESSTVDASNMRVEATSTGNQRIAHVLRTDDNTGSSITMNNGLLIASAPTGVVTITGGGSNITITGSTCILNGVEEACP